MPSAAAQHNASQSSSEAVTVLVVYTWAEMMNQKRSSRGLARGVIPALSFLIQDRRHGPIFYLGGHQVLVPPISPYVASLSAWLIFLMRVFCWLGGLPGKIVWASSFNFSGNHGFQIFKNIHIMLGPGSRWWLSWNIECLPMIQWGTACYVCQICSPNCSIYTDERESISWNTISYHIEQILLSRDDVERQHCIIMLIMMMKCVRRWYLWGKKQEGITKWGTRDGWGWGGREANEGRKGSGGDSTEEMCWHW